MKDEKVIDGVLHWHDTKDDFKPDAKGFVSLFPTWTPYTAEQLTSRLLYAYDAIEILAIEHRIFEVESHAR